MNLDELFPKTDPSKMQPDEICTICHDVVFFINIKKRNLLYLDPYLVGINSI